MQTFDRSKNEYLDHDHEEYALKTDIPNLQEINNLVSLMKKDFEGYKQAQDKHVNDLIDKKLLSLIEVIKDLVVRLDNSITKIDPTNLNSGSFNEPSEIIVNNGTFDLPQSETILDLKQF